jgi:pimeloyl-ACP methyl ester carboxylesterase
VRLIALDRPGVGGSDPQPTRSITGYAADVAEVLDQLGLERPAVGGLSNGGMYAMAIAGELPHRVSRVVPVNPTIPVADDAARASLTRTARAIYSLLQRKRGLFARSARPFSSQGRLARALTRLANPDAHLFTDPVTANQLAAAVGELSRQPDSDYLHQELALAVGDWGFDHRAVTAPVFLVCGEKDSGLGYSRVWAQELPHGQLRLVPGGHMSMFSPQFARTVVQLLGGHE